MTAGSDVLDEGTTPVPPGRPGPSRGRKRTLGELVTDQRLLPDLPPFPRSEGLTLNDDFAEMSERGSHAQVAVSIVDPGELPEEARSREETEPNTIAPEDSLDQSNISNAPPDISNDEPARIPTKVEPPVRPTVKNRPRISFREFVAQYHLHRNHEHKVELLKRRRLALLKWQGLAQRLQRVGSWVQDGLVDMTFRSDKAGFARVHQSLLDLTDLFFSHWRRDMAFSEATIEDRSPQPPSKSDIVQDNFLPRLSAGSKTELFALLHSIRSDPSFLVERLKILSAEQLKILASSLKPQDVQPSSGLSFLSRNRNSPKRRMEAFSQGVEDYAVSLERSSALSFLLFNAFGDCQDSQSFESLLRLQTWSATCASLYLESEERFIGIIDQVLAAFALLSTWRAKQRMELFLMDILQKGAFLLDLVQNSPTSGRGESTRSVLFNPLATSEARQFFDDAVSELFRILDDEDSGFPSSVVQLGRAILARLPTLEDQSRFRGHLFFRWYLNEFLRTVIVYPENENMLLQCHISKAARDSILLPLWQRSEERVTELFSEGLSGSISAEFRLRIEGMIGRLDGLLVCTKSQDLMEIGQLYQLNQQDDISGTTVLVISARDVVQTIDSLFPPNSILEPWDPFIASSATAFNAQYSHTASRLDQLRREVMLLANLAAPVPTVHPCQESWVLIAVDPRGRLSQRFDHLQLAPSKITKSDTSAIFTDCDTVQMAAIKLAEVVESERGPSLSAVSSSSIPIDTRGLESLFEHEYCRSLQRADRLNAYYWHKAISVLREQYPISTLSGNDTRVFEPLVNAIRSHEPQRHRIEEQLENITMDLQDKFDENKYAIAQLRKRTDRLRVKMWYNVDVIHSRPYEDTKNIASALANMAVSEPENAPMAEFEFPRRGRQMPSQPVLALLDQPRRDTISMLRAPNEHGGPQKLSDSQIEVTKRWLLRNGIDNFCRGEERIHRFCMEIKLASRKFVAETLTESPDLWSSELFHRERVTFDASVLAPPAAQTATRPASVNSDTFSTTMPWSRLAQRTQENSARGTLSDVLSLPGRKSSFHSVSSAKLPRDYSGTDRSSSGSSPGRAASATTTDSINSLFSPIAGYSQSVTSISARSRPGSTYNEIESAKLADQSARDKSRFLEILQQDLICMLLSDLGCPVWSCGSETDAWLQKVCRDSAVQARIRKRQGIEGLIPSKPTIVTNKRSRNLTSRQPGTRRSNSAAPSNGGGSRDSPRSRTTDSGRSSSQTSLSIEKVDKYPYTQAYQELLDRFSQEVDPVAKLDALKDFRELAILQLKSGLADLNESAPRGSLRQGRSLPSSRRSSFDPRGGSSATTSSQASTLKEYPLNYAQIPQDEPDEKMVVGKLKNLLFTLIPNTLFRDLQYIASFVSSEMLNETEKGRAFLQFGLAALEYKKEICRSMVDVANKMARQDLIKRRSSDCEGSPNPLRQAAEYWILAAREGEAGAQRELAGLYLNFPNLVPVVTLPLSLSSDVFKSDTRWHPATNVNISHHKMCLALHWMQQAAENGDEIANQRKGDRRRSISIR